MKKKRKNGKSKKKKDKIILSKKKIFITSVLILIMLFLILYNPKVSQNNEKVNIGKCQDYKNVASFDKNVNSSFEALNYVLGYFRVLGYNFKRNDLTVKKIESGWAIEFNSSQDLPFDISKLCVGDANPQKCIGQKLKLESESENKTNILMGYQVPC